MYEGTDFYNLTQELAGAIFTALSRVSPASAETPPILLQLRRGWAESPAWFLVQASEFDPEPISVANLRVRDIYGSERIVYALLELMASEKWLEPTGEADYALTETGRDVLADMTARRERAFKRLTPSLPDADLANLEARLGTLIENSLSAGTPPGNWCLRHSRGRAPAVDAHALAKILQYTSDFNAYRDDAHMAAWRPYDLGGHAWEAFSHVWAATADTAEAIDQALYYRGYSRREYEEALQELVGRGWLTADPDAQDRYVVTPYGQEIRERVEQLTNDYFYAPWQHLSQAELGNLQQLLLSLRDELIRG